MKEIEAKVLEIDVERISAQLKVVGALQEFEGKFRAVYMDEPGGRLKASGEVLRLRQELGNAVLAYKRPLPSEGGVKVREELEVGLDDLDAMKTVLERLGYVATLEIEKIRTQWALDGCHVVIDRHIGAYAHIPPLLEIEAPDVATLHAIAARLGFGAESLCNWSVRELLAHYGAKP